MLGNVALAYLLSLLAISVMVLPAVIGSALLLMLAGVVQVTLSAFGALIQAVARTFHATVNRTGLLPGPSDE